VPSETGNDDFTFPYEQLLHAVSPRLHDAENAWLSLLESPQHLDRRTTELIRLACTTALRHAEGCERHARLAAEAGASLEEILTALVLTQPAFGVLPAAEMFPHAKRGFESAGEVEREE
jgi:alkylhydroperoxidase/carboxymuconolactone decarboxylase family protein YurZ